MIRKWSYDAIIVHYKAPDLLESAIDSLDNQQICPRQIIVVDNSGDLDKERFQSNVETPVIMLTPGTNLGYAAAMNLGAAQSRSSDRGEPTHLLFMTQDVTLERSTCSDLAMAFANGKVGCSAPRLYRTSEPSQIYSAGGTLLAGGQVQHLHESDEKNDHRSVDWVDGALMLVSTAAYAEVSGFSEQYFLYYEEVDFCQRLRQAGYSILVTNAARSWQEPGNYTPYFRMRNQILFCKSFVSIGLRPGTLIYQLARTAVGSCIRRKPVGVLWAFLGTYHGLAGVSGKPPESLKAAFLGIWKSSKN